MDLKNIQKIMQMSGQLQSRVTELQERMAEERYEATSGGGLVGATVDGQGGIQGIRIDPTAVDPPDSEMLEDMVLAAVTQAQAAARAAMEAEMKLATGGLSLPGLGSLLGS